MWDKPVGLRMCGFPQSPSILYCVVIKEMISQWKVQMRALGGVAAKGDEGNGELQANSRGRLIANPEACIGLLMPM